MSNNYTDVITLTPSSSDSDPESTKDAELITATDYNLLLAAIEDILYQISYWNTYKQNCKDYLTSLRNGNHHEVFHFEVYLELKSILSTHYNLSKNILNEYHTVSLLFEDVLYKKLELFDLLPFTISRDQLHVSLRIGIHGLNCAVEPSEIKLNDTNTLCFCEGFIDSVMHTDKYLRSSCFHCLQPECINYGICYSKRKHFSIHNVNQDLSKCSELCLYCHNQMQEDKGKREYGEKVIMLVKSNTPLNKYIDRPIKMCLRDDLIKKVKLCERLIFSGMITHQMIKNKHCAVFEVIHVGAPSKICFFPLYPVNRAKIRKIYENMKNSAWKFVFHMTKLFASKIIPDEMYFGVKLVILLTMVQTVNYDKNDDALTSLCVLSSNTSLINNLYKYAATFYPYYMHYGTEHEILPNMALTISSQDNINAGTFFWSNFIYIMNDLSLCNFNKKDMDNLTKVLENGKIFINHNHEYLKCIAKIIWASNEENSKTKMSFNNVNKMLDCKNLKMKEFINSFNLLYRVDAWDTEEHENMLSQMCISRAMEKETDTFYSTDFWVQYLDSARKFEVNIKDSAALLIRNYVLNRRSFSEKHGNLISFPHSILKILIKLTIAFGKLSFCPIVDIHHAIVPIILLEENLIVRTGCTPFKFLLEDENSIKVTSLFYKPQSDETMSEYLNTIYEYCNNTDS